MKKCEEREACIFLFGIFWQVSEGARRVKRWLPLDWYVSCLVRLTGRSTKRPLVSIIEAHHAPYWSHPIWGAAGLFFFFFFFYFFWDQQPVAGTANLVTWAPYHLRPTLWNWRLFLLSHLLDVTSILEWSVADRFDRQVFFYLQLFCLIEIQWKSINFKCFFWGGENKFI